VRPSSHEPWHNAHGYVPVINVLLWRGTHYATGKHCSYISDLNSALPTSSTVAVGDFNCTEDFPSYNANKAEDISEQAYESLLSRVLQSADYKLKYSSRRGKNIRTCVWLCNWECVIQRYLAPLLSTRIQLNRDWTDFRKGL
jgi:hypothetical protein